MDQSNGGKVPPILAPWVYILFAAGLLLVIAIFVILFNL